MTLDKDLYSLLGVPRNASIEEVRRAYREAALRLHPDKNTRPGDTELFLQVSQAYEVLSDPEQRAAYDEALKLTESEMVKNAIFRTEVKHSRKCLLQLEEPQVHYVLLDVFPVSGLPNVRVPISLSIVIDRSTSMQGHRLDQVRSAVLSILKDLDPMDSVSVVTFSDRAEVVITSDQAKSPGTARARLSLLQAGGGTEIGQGLKLGLEEIEKNFSRETINHLILFTDGRTYGDEDLCLSIAEACADRGITINCVGIGADWSDRLLDDLASRTGGNVVYLDTPRAVGELLERILDELEHVVVSKVQVEGAVAQQVDLRSTFRIHPEPMPMGDSLPIFIGNLLRDSSIRLLLELVVHPIGQVEDLVLAHLTITGDLVSGEAESVGLPLEVRIPASKQPDPNPPPDDIIDALNQISLYRMQEKARHEAELGQATRAARRLENLATHLLASGERELAKAALTEAERLTHTRRLSTEGEKTLKYGTRALLLPPKAEDR